MFIWKACKNAIPTRLNLARRRCFPSPSCPICQAQDETVEHVLLRCEWTRPFWFSSNLQWDITKMPRERFDSWLMEGISKLTRCKDNYEDEISLLFHSCWIIWKSRNEAIFGNINIDPFYAIQRVNSMVLEFKAAVSLESKPPNPRLMGTQPNQFTWSPPSFPTIKCNIDAGIDKTTSIGVAATIFRDFKGDFLTGSISRF